MLIYKLIIDTHPKAVTQHKDIIMTCLDDKDESIRLRALDLISRMVTKTTIMEIVAKLLDHAKKTENMIYRDDLVSKLIQMCAQSNYANIHNFEWYLNVLLDLTKLEGKSKFGDKIAFQVAEFVRLVSQKFHFIFSDFGCYDSCENASGLFRCTNVTHFDQFDGYFNCLHEKWMLSSVAICRVDMRRVCRSSYRPGCIVRYSAQ